MDLSFFALTLEAIDQAAGDALCLFVGEDERPLTGLAGLADWRLQGGLSRYLRSGLVTGTAGEALLTLGTRLGFKRLFLFGLGPRSQSEEELAERVAEAMRKLAQAGVEEAALQLPSKLSLDTGVRTLIDEPNGPARALVFGPDPAALVRALSHAASRGGVEARHERRVVKVPGPPKAQPPARTGQVQQTQPSRIEIPKASPLSFAPQAKVEPAPAITLPEPRPPAPAIEQSEPPVAPVVNTTPPPPIAADRSETPMPPLAEPTPVPTPMPPIVEPTPAPPVNVTVPPPKTEAQAKADAQLAAAKPEAKPQGSVPVTYKPERFVPPAPKVLEGGKKKKRKR